MKVNEAAETFESLFRKVQHACHACSAAAPEGPAPGGERQARLLDHLDPHVLAHPGALALHMGITPSTVSLTVDRLVAAGLALRERPSGDARRVGIRLTAAGSRVRDARTGLDPDRVRALLRRLSPGRRRKALRGLKILAKAARRFDPARPSVPASVHGTPAT